MANEILSSSVGDLTTSEVLAGLVLMSLADREDFFGHPVMTAGYAGSVVGSGSATKKVSELGLGGVDLATAQTEGAEMSNTPLGDDSHTVTTAWYGKAYDRSDLARMMTPAGMIDLQAFAIDTVLTVAQTVVSLVAQLGSGFSASAGTSGANMTYTDWLEAITLADLAQARGPFLGILHPRQFGDLRTNAATVAGSLQYRPDFAGAVNAQNSQMRGNLSGVDVFVTSHVPTANAGADRAGCIVSPGAFIWADGQIDSDGDPNILTFGTRGALERDRRGKSGQTNYLTHLYVGVAEAIDAAGVGIITDA